MPGVEFAGGRNASKALAEALPGLARAAGMSLPELVDDIEAGGLPAALRRAAERAGRRNHHPRKRQIELLARRD